MIQLHGLGPGLLCSALIALLIRTLLPFFLDDLLLWLFLGLLPLTLLGAALPLRLPGWLVGVAAIAAVGLPLWPRPAAPPLQLIVLGVDGATFDLIDPMVADGELPGFARLQAEGARAELVAREPLSSPVLWTTIASGHPPSEHGIFSFRVRADHCRVPRFWDVLAAEGLEVGLFGWLVTWPCPDLPGFCVPGWLAGDARTRPPELGWIKELELSRRLRRQRRPARSLPVLTLEGLRSGLRLSTLARAAAWQLRSTLLPPSEDRRFVEEQRLRTRISRDAFIHALWTLQPDVATLTLYATDGVAHRAWEEHARGEGALSEAVRDSYRDADEVLAELLDWLPGDVPILVLSDHGSRATRSDGATRYLRLRTEPISDRLQAIAPVDLSRVGGKLTVVPHDPDDRERIAASLRALRLEDGRPLLRVEPLPAVSHGLGVSVQAVTLAPEGLLQTRVAGRALGDWVRVLDAYSGAHDPRGILLIRAPGVQAGAVLPEAAQIDVAPTLYALLDVAPPPGLAGSPVVGAALPARPKPVPLRAGERGAVPEHVVEALRELGYVD